MRPHAVLGLLLLACSAPMPDEGTSNTGPLHPVLTEFWHIAGNPNLGAYDNGMNQQPVDFGVWQAADGSGGSERLSTSDGVADLPLSFSPDGQLLVFIRVDPATQRDIWVLSMKDRQQRSLVLGTPATEGAARISPDGRWIAYVSDESGRPEIYVQSFPGPGGKWQISTDGGIEPAWSRNGRELFYRSGDRMMAVPVTSQAASFTAGRPAVLFEGSYVASTFPLAGVTYDVTPDGKRFLMLKEQATSTTHINVVVNWFEELKRLVPLPGTNN